MPRVTTGSGLVAIARARLGRTIARKWRLEEILGVGGMATVYRARHRNGDEVAIKLLHPSLAGSEIVRETFVREACLVNRIGHPGVPRVIDDDVDEDGALFLVMDLIPGVSLATRGRMRLLDDQEVLEVAEQALEILSVAHARGIVHRDIKPDNFLIDDAGTVRIVDFGIARGHTSAASMTTLSRADRTYGTAGYLSPEQANGRSSEISPRTDLYSLGATLFRLVTGALPHEGRTPQELIVAAATAEPRRVHAVAPNVSADVAALIDRALHLDPKDRWSSADEMLREVIRLKFARGLAAAPLRPPPQPRKISARVRVVRAGLEGRGDETQATLPRRRG